MRLTERQLELLKVIGAGNPDGTVADLDQIIERASYKPTKASIQFSLRALEAHELIERAGTEKRRARQRALWKVTAMGQHYFNYHTHTSAPPVVTSVDDEELLSEIESINN